MDGDEWAGESVSRGHPDGSRWRVGGGKSDAYHDANYFAFNVGRRERERIVVGRSTAPKRRAMGLRYARAAVRKSLGRAARFSCHNDRPCRMVKSGTKKAGISTNEASPVTLFG
jgi:hypothetical protein